MSTLYIPTRDSAEITRQQIIAKFGKSNLIVSEDDEKEGKTLDNVKQIGVFYDGESCWISMWEDKLANIEIYGRTSDEVVDYAFNELGLKYVSEHDDDFGYHCFPVDVKTTVPNFSMDDWCGYCADGYVWIWNKKTNEFYDHCPEDHNPNNPDDDYDFEKHVASLD